MSNSGIEQSGARPLRVLLVVPEGDGTQSLIHSLRRAGFESRALFSVDAAALAATHHRPVAIVLEGRYLIDRGHRLIETLRLAAPQTPILVLADGGDEKTRLKALLLGAEDCLIRPISDQEAVVRIRRAVERREGLRRLAVENQETRERSGRMKVELGDLRRQLFRNVSLLQRGVDLHRRLDPEQGRGHLVRTGLENLGAQTGVDRLAFLGRGRTESSWLTVTASFGLPASLEDVLRIPASGEIASILRSTAGPVLLDRLSSVPGTRIELGVLATGGFTAAVPVLTGGRLVGIVLLGEVRDGGAPDQETLRIANFLTTSLAPALSAQEAREHDSYLSTRALGHLVSHLEGRDPYLRGHSQRVARLAEDLGIRAGFGGTDLTFLNVSAILHDIGRFEVDCALWSKLGPLTPEDWNLIRRHPEEGERLAAEAAWPARVLEAIKFHHERWDGAGYPRGLRGEAIPLPARILAVADAFEALTSPRAYRPPRSHPEAIETLRRDAGSKFDPDLVELFVEEPEALLEA